MIHIGINTVGIGIDRILRRRLDIHLSKGMLYNYLQLLVQATQTSETRLRYLTLI